MTGQDYLIGSVASILFAGFFAGAETGLVSLEKIGLQEKGGLSGKIIRKLTKNIEKTLSVILIGTNIFSVSATIFTVMFFQTMTSNFITASLYTTLTLTPVMFVFSELLPKNLFQAYADTLTYKVSFILIVFYYLLLPVQMIFSIVPYIAVVIFRGKTKGKRKSHYTFSRDEIDAILQMAVDRGQIKQPQREFVERITGIAELRAREIMTPLIEVFSVPVDSTVLEVAEIIKKKGFSIIPVYRNRIDEIEGYITAKDLARCSADDKLEDVMRKGDELLFVPEVQAVSVLISQMQEKRVPVAFVVDEHGGFAGMVTRGDIAEIIVGEMLEESEEEEEIFKEVEDKGIYIASGSMDIDDLEDRLGIQIPKEGFETLNGFMEFHLNKIPEVGDGVWFGGYCFKVIEADRTKAVKVEIKKTKKRKKNECEGKNEHSRSSEV